MRERKNNRIISVFKFLCLTFLLSNLTVKVCFGETNIQAFEFPPTRAIQSEAFFELSNDKLKGEKLEENQVGMLFEPFSAVSTISNEHLTVRISEYGQFTIKRKSDGKWLLFPDESTTYISIKINENVYHNREQYIGQIHTPLTFENQQNAYIEYITPEQVIVRITFSLLGESLALQAEAFNNSGQSHFVKTRFLLDTQLDQNDGAPLYAPGYTHPDGSSILTYEAGVHNPFFIRWGAQDRYENPTFKAYGYFQDRPYLMVFAYWPNVVGYYWDFAWNVNDTFSSDSAVAIYFDMGNLDPGKTEKVVTYYGLGEPDISVAQDRLRLICDQLANTIMTLSENFTRKTSHGFAKGYATLKREQGHQKAQAFVNSLSAILNLERALLQTPAEAAKAKAEIIKIATDAGFSDAIGEAYYMLWEVNFFLDYLGDLLAFRDGVIVSHEYIFSKIGAYLGEIDPSMSQTEIERTLFTFLWEELDWSGTGEAYEKGINGFHEEITKRALENLAIKWENYSGPGDEEVLLAVIKKLESYRNGLQSAESRARLFLWLNEEALKTELGNVHGWQILLDHAVIDLASPASRWGSWGFTGLSAGVAIGKAAFAIKSMGLTVVAELVVSAAVTIPSFCHETFMRAPKEARLQRLTYDNFLANIQEDINMAIATAALAKYLDYDNVPALFDQMKIDNNNIIVKELRIKGEKEVAFRNEEMLDISSFITFSIENEGLDTVPLDAVIVFYDYESNASISQEPVAIAFLKEGGLYPYATVGRGNTRALNFDDIFLAYKTGSGFDYVAKAYVAPGPAIISKLIGPRMVDFNITRDRDVAFWRATRRVVVEDRISQGTAHEAQYLGAPDAVFTDLSLLYSGSDLNLHVYDQQGRHVGVNYQTGVIENEIPGATYSGPAANPQWMRLPNSAGARYTTRIVALDGIDVGYSLTAVDVPDLQAMLSFSQERLSATVDKLKEDQVTLYLSVEEVGGQREVESITFEMSDLTGSSGTISSSFIEIIMEDKTLAPSGVLTLEMTISDISSFPEGEFEGVLTVRGMQGAASEDRQLSAAVVSQTTEEVEAEISVQLTVENLESQTDTPDSTSNPPKKKNSSGGCFIGVVQ